MVVPKMISKISPVRNYCKNKKAFFAGWWEKYIFRSIILDLVQSPVSIGQSPLFRVPIIFLTKSTLMQGTKKWLIKKITDIKTKTELDLHSTIFFKKAPIPFLLSHYILYLFSISHTCRKTIPWEKKNSVLIVHHNKIIIFC